MPILVLVALNIKAIFSFYFVYSSPSSSQLQFVLATEFGFGVGDIYM